MLKSCRARMLRGGSSITVWITRFAFIQTIRRYWTRGSLMWIM